MKLHDNLLGRKHANINETGQEKFSFKPTQLEQNRACTNKNQPDPNWLSRNWWVRWKGIWNKTLKLHIFLSLSADLMAGEIKRNKILNHIFLQICDSSSFSDLMQQLWLFFLSFYGIFFYIIIFSSFELLSFCFFLFFEIPFLLFFFFSSARKMRFLPLLWF